MKTTKKAALIVLLVLTLSIATNTIYAATLNPETDAMDGFIEYRGGVFDHVDTTDLITGMDWVSNDYEWRRIIMAFDINNLGAVRSATLYLDYESTKDSESAGTFDLNSIYAGNDINAADWDSPVYEKVTDDWFDCSILAWDTNTDVTTAWNNAIAAGREHLDFRLALDDDISRTANNQECGIDFQDTDEAGTSPYIDYELVCDCPTTGNWEITNGAICTLNTTCSLTSGDLYIQNGSLNIANGGILHIPINRKVIIENTNASLYIENGGKLIIGATSAVCTGDICLNSATGKTCNTICTENGFSSCTSIGVDDGAIFGKFLLFPGCPQVSGATCGTAMADTSGVCFGENANWTNCKCVP